MHLQESVHVKASARVCGNIKLLKFGLLEPPLIVSYKYLQRSASAVDSSISSIQLLLDNSRLTYLC